MSFNSSISYLLLLVILLSGCSKKLNVFSRTYDRESLAIQEFKFDYLTIKSKVKLEETHKTTNATALLRIKKDSIIWFNLSGALGVQGMRGIITQDSVKLINRVDKQYLAYSYEDVSKEFNFPIDYDLVQAMIIGDMPKSKEPDDNTRLTKGRYIVRQNLGNIAIANYINPGIMKLEEVFVTEKESDNSLKLLYKDFRELNNQAFPFSSFISLIHNNEFGELETQLTIEHNRVEVSDEPLKFPFTVPKKYEIQ